MGLFDGWEGFDVQEERRIGQTKGEEIYGIAVKYAPEYDSEKIYNELTNKNNLVKS
nr:hypothetical protein [uncultured Butyrivibrio sp.]